MDRTPNIIEEARSGFRIYSIADDMLRNREISLLGTVDEDSVNSLVTQLLYLEKASPGEDRQRRELHKILPGAGHPQPPHRRRGEGPPDRNQLNNQSYMRRFFTILFAVVGFCLLLGEGDTFAASLAIKGAAVACLILALVLKGTIAKEGRA